MIVAQPGGCNAAVEHKTHGLTMTEEDGSGHPGKGKIGQERTLQFDGHNRNILILAEGRSE